MTPLRAFPVIRYPFTDVSFNDEKASEIPLFTARLTICSRAST